MEIVRLEAPTMDHWKAIRTPLGDFNREKVGDVGASMTIAYGLRAPGHEEIEGGLWAEIYWNWMSLYLLVVPAEARGLGIGSDLLQRAEAFAAENSCIGVWLDTFSFQAPEFYCGRGYEVFAELDQYPHDAKRMFLRKRLAR